MFRLGIIGSAGRANAPQELMTAELYQVMVLRAVHEISRIPVSEIILVSGGAPWSDHVAVELFLNKDKYELIAPKIKGLELHLAAPFDEDTNRYLDTGARDWRANPGRSENRYHDLFCEKLGDPDRSFRELRAAIDGGASVKVYNGFHQRNTYIATANYLLAFSWGRKNLKMEGLGILGLKPVE
jgi:hypothetical protein